MGRNNVLKRQLLEEAQTISNIKKPKALPKKEPKKASAQPKKFIALSEPIETTTDCVRNEGGSWSFDEHGNLITQDKSTKVEKTIEAQEEEIVLSDVRLGKNSRFAKSPAAKSSFSKLVSTLNLKAKVNSLIKVKSTKEKFYGSDKKCLVEDVSENANVLSENVSKLIDVNDGGDSNTLEEDAEAIQLSAYEPRFGPISYGDRLETLIEKVSSKDYDSTQLNVSGCQILLNTPSGASSSDIKVPKHLKLAKTDLSPRIIASLRTKFQKENFDGAQASFFYMLNQYRDVLHTCLSADNSIDLRTAYLVHSLNHILRSYEKIQENDKNIALARKNHEEPGEIRDSGFTKPKVLILVPFRSSALHIVKMLFDLSGCKKLIGEENLEKQYGLPEGVEDTILRSNKPLDFRTTFAGNTSETFVLSMQLTSKTMQVFSKYYDSDIILASPLGLRLHLNAKGKHNTSDFLSSIEILVMDQTDHMLMQNWEHLTYVLGNINKIPEKAHNCDFSRVKSWYLDDHSMHLRQTILISHMATPEFNNLFSHKLSNVAGQAVFYSPITEGTISQVTIPTKQVFQRIHCHNIVDSDDARFSHFIDSTFPVIRRNISIGKKTLLFIPSYLDFVRVRNYLTEHEYNFTSISDYSTPSEQDRNRFNYFKTNTNLMLYTERIHFYRRLKIKASCHVVFYALPEYSHFYPELINMATVPDSNSLEPAVPVTVLFTTFDALKLERILGVSKARKACHGSLSTLVFP